MPDMSTTPDRLSPPPRARGVSLIETFVSISVIGVMFTMTLPIMAQARFEAAQTRSLAQARDIAITIDMHCSTHRGWFPVARLPADLLDGVVFDLDDETHELLSDPVAARWESRTFWWTAMADTAPVETSWPAWVSPGADDAGARLRGPDYHFSNSFVAQPQLWTTGFSGTAGRPASARVLRDVSASQVRFPGSKAMIWDAALAYVPERRIAEAGADNIPVPIAFTDGHAEARPLAEASEAVPNVLHHRPWRAGRLHNTADGVVGRDF